MKIKKTMLIGISGKSKSGKDTVVNIMRDSGYKVFSVSPGDKIRDAVASITGVSPKWLLDNEDRYGFIRSALQNVSSVARHRRPDYWWSLVKKDLILALDSKKYQFVVVPSIRLMLEANDILKMSGELWRIHRPIPKLKGDMGTHDTETELDEWKRWDAVFHNILTLEHFKRSVQSLLAIKIQQ